jgi:hypothetical protein
MTFCSGGFQFSLGLPVALPLRDYLPPLSLLDRSESMAIFALPGEDVKARGKIYRHVSGPSGRKEPECSRTLDGTPLSYWRRRLLKRT